MRASLPIIVCALVTVFMASESSASLLTNGTAEAPLSPEWVKDGPNVNAIQRVQSSRCSGVTPHSGLWFVSFCEAPSAWGTLTQRGTAGLDEPTLVLSGYFTHSGTDNGSVSVMFYEDVGGESPISIVSSGPLLGEPFTWTPFSLEAPVPNNANEWAVELRGDLGVAGIYTAAFFDDVVFFPTSEAPCHLLLMGQAPSLVYFDAPFDVVVGFLSDLRTDGDFTWASCLDSFTESPGTDELPDPSGGEGRYYLARGQSGCTSYGDSSMDPDPRDDLDNVDPCP